MEVGNSARAVDILTSIVQYCSNYQLAQDLLAEAIELEASKAVQQRKVQVAAQQLYAKQLQLQKQKHNQEEERRRENATLVLVVISALILFIVLASCFAR